MVDLSRRETEALLSIACHGYLTRTLIERFLFDGDQTVSPISRKKVCLRVLERLRGQGLIEATPRALGGVASGSTPAAYRLTRAGSRLASLLRDGFAARRPARRGTFLLAHGLATAEVALTFRDAARANPGHMLLDWSCGWEAAQRFGSGHVVPDARLLYQTAEWVLDAFLEVDLGSEGTRFFARKVERYLDLYRSGEWRQQLTSWPVVLTVAHTEARASALRRATESVLAAPWDVGETEFDFAAMPDLLGPLGPLGPIWQVAGRDGRRPLFPESIDGGAIVPSGQPPAPGREPDCAPYQPNHRGRS